jgi:hypothetical protein
MVFSLPLTYIINSLLKMYVMKKIFTLLFAVGLFTMANAQPGQRDNRNGNDRDVIKVVVTDNDRYDNDGYGNSAFGKERKTDPLSG